MGLRFNDLRVEAADPERLALFWLKALGWYLVIGNKNEMMIAPTTSRPLPADALAVIFKRSTSQKVGRNRLFFDLTPSNQAAEVARLEGLGATRLDIDLGDPRWVVMADPEGNEFCVLHEHGQLPAKRTPQPESQPE